MFGIDFSDVANPEHRARILKFSAEYSAQINISFLCSGLAENKPANEEIITEKPEIDIADSIIDSVDDLSKFL